MVAGTVERRASERRIRRISLRYPERRSGFDRRAAGSTRFRRLVEAVHDGPKLLAAFLVVIVALQAADILLTDLLLAAGAAELNPVMARLFEAGTPVPVLLKAAVTAVLVAGIWRLRRYRRILEFAVVLTAGLVLVVGYQAVAVLTAGV